MDKYYGDFRYEMIAILNALGGLLQLPTYLGKIESKQREKNILFYFGYSISIIIRGRLVFFLKLYFLECDSRKLKFKESDFIMFGILRKC